MKRFTKLDLFLYITVFALIICLIIISSKDGKSDFIIIKTEKGNYRYNLDKDQIHTFTGPVGETVVEIKDNKVHILSSDCHNKTCVESGYIDHGGQTLVCLPNKIVVKIEGNNDVIAISE